MADDRDRNQGMEQGTGEGGGQHAPGRNPKDDRSAGGQKGGNQPGQGGQQGGNQPDKGGQQQGGQGGGTFKEGEEPGRR